MKKHKTLHVMACCAICAIAVITMLVIPTTSATADASTDLAEKQIVAPELQSASDTNLSVISSDSTAGKIIQIPKVEFIGSSLSIENGTNLIFYADISSVHPDLYSYLTLELSVPAYSSVAVDGPVIMYPYPAYKMTYVTIDEFTVVQMNGKTVAKFVYSDLSAKEYASRIVGKILFDGHSTGAFMDFSAKDYAKYQIASDISPKLNTLLVDMLNFGASAQTYFKYNLLNPANAELTQEQKAYATEKMPQLVSIQKKVKGEDGLVSVNGMALSFTNTFDMTVVFQPNCDLNDIYAVVEYVDMKGNAKTMTVDSIDFNAYSNNNRYSIVFSEYGATQMNDAITVKFFDKNTTEQIGDTYTDSINSYAIRAMANGDADMRNLMEMMVKYGQSAEAYFG